jgi:uncharacterized protein YndB with AHSA1/START domain
MSKALERTVSHGVFTLERTYPDVTPQRVFNAFATPEGKAGWFSGPDAGWTIVERAFDFRVGGAERLVGRWTTGMVTAFEARYFDIVPGERIVYAYEMRLDDRKISVSLATIEFKAVGDGARLVLTEQGAFLDGYDDAGSRERGTRELIDKLSAWLSRADGQVSAA